jgi:hypothetical protein
MRLREERWRPGWNPGGPGFQDGVSGRKMALRIAGWASGKPGWQPGKKDDGPGSQKAGRERKMAIGITKNRLSKEISRPGSLEGVREPKKRGGNGKRPSGALGEAHPGKKADGEGEKVEWDNATDSLY